MQVDGTDVLILIKYDRAVSVLAEMNPNVVKYFLVFCNNYYPFHDLHYSGYLKVLVSYTIFHSAISEKSIDCLKLLWFLVFQQLEYFLVALPACNSNFTVSHGLYSLSLHPTVILGFILVGNVVLWCLLCQLSCYFEGIMLLFL